MPTVFLLVGLPGAGKTTLAKQLEHQHRALRFSPDEWIASLYGHDIQDRDRPTFEAARGTVERLQRDVAGQLLALGVNVILENGFWDRTERDEYRAWARTLGAKVELHYLNVSRDELWARLSRRNEDLPQGTFRVREDELDLWLSAFAPPSDAEIAQS